MMHTCERVVADLKSAVQQFKDFHLEVILPVKLAGCMPCSLNLNKLFVGELSWW